jgi:hypothetical protein
VLQACGVSPRLRILYTHKWEGLVLEYIRAGNRLNHSVGSAVAVMLLVAMGHETADAAQPVNPSL